MSLPRMEKFELISFPNASELAQAAADAWLKEIASVGDAPHCVALSGGRIAQSFFPAVATCAHAQKISFATVHFFWADERCVSPESADSNFRLAQELLLSPLEIAKDHIHRLRSEEPADFACAEAEAEICRLASLNSDGLPVLDLIFLGLGEDGHVASLFPGQPEPPKDGRFAYRAIANSPKPPPNRITLSYAALAVAKKVWVLASGAGKEATLQESLKPDGKTPLARVIRSRSNTRVFTDIPVG